MRGSSAGERRRLRGAAGWLESDIKAELDACAKDVQAAALAAAAAVPGGGPQRASQIDADADKYFRPFQVAAEPRRSAKMKVREKAADAPTRARPGAPLSMREGLAAILQPLTGTR